MSVARKVAALYWPECQAPHPYHRSGVCECGPADSIHGPAEDCEAREGEPCPNPASHHAFTPAVSSDDGTRTSSPDTH